MAVNKVPVLKRCRSLGLEPSYLGYDKKSNRELKRANKKVSEYGLQLREKQKAKFIYVVLEKPFHNYYVKADQMKGMTGTNLMTMLESRLDNVVFRMGFARTRKEARQIVDHKFVLVNGKQVNIPSYLVKAGDVIEIKEKNKGLQRMCDIAIKEAGDTTGKRAVVCHVNNPERGEYVKQELAKRASFKEIVVTNAAGVATVYANDGGIVLAIG